MRVETVTAAQDAAISPDESLVVLGLDANGVTHETVRITVPGSGPAVCVRWSSDGTRIAYLDGGTIVIRGLDGSTLASAAGDPSVADFGDPSISLPSPSGAWAVRVEFNANGCELVVAKPNGTATHIFPLSYCPYAIAAWSPDGRQVLLMQDVGDAFALMAIAVDRGSQVTVVSTVGTNGARSWPGRGDVSWQPVFP